jgi:hypothetical protein
MLTEPPRAHAAAQGSGQPVPHAAWGAIQVAGPPTGRAGAALDSEGAGDGRPQRSQRNSLGGGAAVAPAPGGSVSPTGGSFTVAGFLRAGRTPPSRTQLGPPVRSFTGEEVRRPGCGVAGWAGSSVGALFSARDRGGVPRNAGCPPNLTWLVDLGPPPTPPHPTPPTHPLPPHPSPAARPRRRPARRGRTTSRTCGARPAPSPPAAPP